MCSSDLALGVQSEIAVPAWHMARLDLEEGDLDAALVNLDTAAAAARLGDPEHYGPAIEVLRAQVLACTDNGEAARALITRVEARLGRLPMLRRVQVMIDLADTWRLLGEPELARSRAREVLQVSALRGFRFYQLDALMLLLRIAGDAEVEHARADVRALAREIAASLPMSWQPTFLARVEGTR